MPLTADNRCPRHPLLAVLAAASLIVAAAGCSGPSGPLGNNMEPDNASQAVLAALQSVKAQYAPDSHLAVFDITPLRQDGQLLLKGEVDNPAAKQAALAAAAGAAANVIDRVAVLPSPDLGDRTWGIASLSVLNAREKPGHASEMGTQILMGYCFKIWKSRTNWFLVQGADGYLGWTEGGSFAWATREQVNHWNASPLLIVTAFEERILEQPDSQAPPVSDVVMGDLVRCTGLEGDWFKVELPDGRAGYLPKSAAADYAQWRKSRRPTPENIESTARSFLGRPYFWGGNSIRGMDCSGLTQFVFFLNGIDLPRNASQQRASGPDLPLAGDLSYLRKGDLLFFGRRATARTPEKITHVAIYLGGKLFIHSSDRVRLNSLDPASPLSDPPRIRSLLHARRVLPDPPAKN